MKSMNITCLVGLALLMALVASPAVALAGGGCTVCRLVKKEKKVTVVCYGTKCKDICLPSCGSKCLNVDGVKAGKCSGVCCNKGGVCKVKYATGEPGCAKLKTVKKLVKYEVTKTVPSWSWEIVKADAGCGCEAKADCGCDATR